MNQMKKIVYTALFTALCCIATMLIQIPLAATNGYIHLGDAFVILSGIILGKKYGGFAAGVGSAFADLFTGYAYFAPITFVIKFLTAFCTAVIYKRVTRLHVNKMFAVILCGITAIVIVTGGYFIYNYIMIGPAALLSVPGNIVQGLSGLVISFLLFPVLDAVPDIRVMRTQMNSNMMV